VSTSAIRYISMSNEQENPPKRQKLDALHSTPLSNTLVETTLIKQIRRRTFSHWSRRIIPSSAQMIEAGFFSCNIGDRVICIYCNLICQQWIPPHTYDPCEVHKTLSPKCPYVKSKLIHYAASSTITVDECSTGVTSSSHLPTSCNPAYAEIPQRHASFATWPNKNVPSVDKLVQAGFFYTGTKTIVTCFYCNGTLNNWGANDNPMIEHARWFSQCAYAKQLCGDELYRKIQETKRVQHGMFEHY
jgi:baculoviral IAP repeat-containing protein 7/8